MRIILIDLAADFRLAASSPCKMRCSNSAIRDSNLATVSFRLSMVSSLIGAIWDCYGSRNGDLTKVDVDENGGDDEKEIRQIWRCCRPEAFSFGVLIDGVESWRTGSVCLEKT